jgi:iron complex outermembrane recepter protein
VSIRFRFTSIASLTLVSAQAFAELPHLVAPTVKTHTEPGYPSPEVAAGRDATVVLIVTIDREGHVVDAVVETSQGPNFDEAALVTARQWTFFPAERNGAPVAAKIKVPFHFAPPPGKIVTAPEAAKHEHAQGEQVSVDEHVHPEEVRIYGRSSPVSRGASDFTLNLGELGRVPRQNASALLTLAPGIFQSNEGGDGHAEQIFLRGFDAREGQDLAVSVGGVPANESGNLHANGYADTHFVLPELVESLRVVEGPFDPRQGNYAVAGSAEYNLGLSKRGISARTTLGSWNTQRLLVLWGPKAASQHTFGGAEIYKTDGFGANRASKRASAMAQYEGSLGENASYRIFVSAYGTDYQSAGLIRRDDERNSRQDFYGSYDNRQGGNATRFSMSADFETKQKDAIYYAQFYVVTRGMRIKENFTGFLEDPQTPFQNPHGQRGDLIDRDIASTTVGSRGFARIHGRAFQRKHEFEVGYAARYDAVDATQYRIGAKTDVPYRLDIDNRPKLADLGVYLDGTLRPLPRVALKAGLRANLFTFNVLNGCAAKTVRRPSEESPPGDASCLSQGDFGVYREPVARANTASIALLPRATLDLGPYDGVNFTASFGRGVRTTDPIYVLNNVDTPFASVTAYEGGVVYAKNFEKVSLVVRSIFFGTHVDRDLIFSQAEGRNTLANGTTRTGWIAALRMVHPWLDESAHLTLVRSRFDDSGLLVPYVPNVVFRSDTALHHDLPWKLDSKAIHAKLSAGVSYVGKRALPYGQESDALVIVDGSASATWGMFMLDLSASNLLDRKLRLGEYNFASDWQNQGNTRPTLVPARHFSSGPPRSLFLTLGVTLGGDS